MSPEWTVFSSSCPSRASLARVANKWTAMIVVLLHDQPLRFSELHRGVEGITKKVLADTLRALERDGMIVRAQHGDGHARYELTTLGHTLHEPLQALQVWAESHVEEVLSAQERYDEEIDGRLLGDDTTDPSAASPSAADRQTDILHG